MARYRVKKIRGKFFVQNMQMFIWWTISNGFTTSNQAIKAAQDFIESEKDNGKIVWESKE